MRDLSTLAKLLAEEDIHVVHRQQSTAAFDVKNRELSLPIWKEMSKDVQDLMTVHEVGHALWTPIEMLERAQKENIEFSFVNVLEDVRIEKKVQTKYLGSVKVFNRGYKELASNNFFGTKGQDISNLNLIDRINLHYKHFDNVPFSDAEMVWVEKSNQTVTPDDVLELAKELYGYIQNNPESQGEEPAESDLEDHIDAMMGPSDPLGQEENSDNSGEDTDSSGDSSDEGDESSEETSGGKSSDDEGSEEAETSAAGSEKSDDVSDEKSENKDTTAESMSEGGKANGQKITAVTDSVSEKSSSELLDNTARDRTYAIIPKIQLENVIVDYKKIMTMYQESLVHQRKMCGNLYFETTKESLQTFLKDNKKTVAYMVKEFEMKKAADQYSRASTSKTGSLDMGRLHTYKYNDDLFKKVTTLPGATNHALVLFLDWSGSMSGNLQGTLNQLYNLILFCKRTQIPFEVFGFSDMYDREQVIQREKSVEMAKFKSGELVVKECHLLQFFSSKMKSQEITTMMHYLNMYASTWSRGVRGQRYIFPRALELGGTPLNQAAVCALEFIPMYKKQTGVQKINTVFLTDGSGCELTTVNHIGVNYEGNEYNTVIGSGWRNDMIMIDKVTNTTVRSTDFDDNNKNLAMILALLKKRVPEMNVVNFFVAGNGRSGRVDKHEIRNLLQKKGEDWGDLTIRTKEAVKKINKENVLIFNDKQGFDQLYLLPGLNSMTANESLDVEIGASKAQLKKAFGKMANGKLSSRPLLNNFVKMVA